MKGPRPYELAAATPPKHLVPALVRNLAEVLGGQAVYGKQTATGTVPVASWPVDAVLGDGTMPAPLGLAREPVDGGGIVLVAGVRRWGDAEQAVLRETALWLGMATRLAQLTGDHDRASVRAAGLRAELAAARERLAQVRDLERRRLVGAITTTTLRDLAEVREKLTGITADTAADDLAEARGALDDLIDDFRTVVRGVYPAMLPDRGPRAALEELAATLPRSVRFGGDLGRRVGWQVESGLYHAVAAVLNVLAGLDSTAATPIEVRFDRDDALRVRVTADAGGLADHELRTTLGHDAQRVAVLGGAMECLARDGVAVVTVRVAERIEPAEPAPLLEDSPLYREVRDLVRQGQEAADEQDRPRWAAVAERMAEPPRLAVVGAPPSEHPPGVTVVPVGGPLDEQLAEEFLTDDGVDAVLCLVPPTSVFRAALRWGRQRVELSESTGIDRLAGKLVAWRPVIAARRAVVAATELVRTLPDDHPLRWAVDRVRAEAHEIAELDLLDDLQRGDSRLLRGRDVDAARLLGATGTDSRARLGLADNADEAQVRAAARDAAGRWRGHAEHPATGGRDRVACEVLARTAEGILGQA